MQPFTSLVAVLAATIIALPTSNTPRQLGALGGVTAPVTAILSQVGKYIPGGVGKLTPGGEKTPPTGPAKTNGTAPATKPAAKPDAGPLGSLTGVLGGV